MLMLNSSAMYIQKSDLLSIHPSASKPSLLSSFWSIHVQAQPQDGQDLDVKSCSQASLPDAFDMKPNPLRSTKSMSDLNLNADSVLVPESSRRISAVEGLCKEENLTSRVTAWLTRIDIQDTK